MHLLSFDRFVWAAGLYANILLLAVLIGRRRAASFPIFTTLIASDIVRTVVLYLVRSHGSDRAYARSYWSLGVLDEALQLLIVYEIAVHVFRPTGVWARDLRKAFAVIAAASLLVALGLTWLDSPNTPINLQAVVYRGNLFSAALLSELFVAMVALSATAGLPWKTHVARIAQGLGVYSIVCLACDTAATCLGDSVGTSLVLSHMRILTYLGCEGFWIVMLWKQAPAPRPLPEAMRAQIFALQRQVEYDLTRVRTWRRS
jgi:hypothetical protein